MHKFHVSYVDNKEKLIAEKTTQYFTDEKLPDEDINKILEAGRNATTRKPLDEISTIIK